jgi:hypothetical protein
LQSAFFEERLRKVCEAKSVYPEANMLKVWNLRGYAKPMDELIEVLLDYLRPQHFSLVALDPVYKLLPPIRGAENDSALITKLLNALERIANETGAAVLFTSHFSKGIQADKESMDRISGSGAWARDADTVLTMTHHEDQNSFTVEAEAIRNFEPFIPFVMKWDYPLFVRTKADPKALRGSKGGAAIKKTLDQLVEAFRNSAPMPATEFVLLTADKLEIAERTAWRLFYQAKENGAISCNKKKWQINTKWTSTKSEVRPEDTTPF